MLHVTCYFMLWLCPYNIFVGWELKKTPGARCSSISLKIFISLCPKGLHDFSVSLNTSRPIFQASQIPKNNHGVYISITESVETSYKLLFLEVTLITNHLSEQVFYRVLSGVGV